MNLPAHAEYLILLIAGWLSLLWVDLHYGTEVLASGRRLFIAEGITLSIFLAWDSLGVHRGYWRSRPARVVGLWPLPGVPVEEFLLLAMITYGAIVLWRLSAILTGRSEAPGQKLR